MAHELLTKGEQALQAGKQENAQLLITMLQQCAQSIEQILQQFQEGNQSQGVRTISSQLTTLKGN
jgi:uncharacterized protein YukE